MRQHATLCSLGSESAGELWLPFVRPPLNGPWKIAGLNCTAICRTLWQGAPMTLSAAGTVTANERLEARVTSEQKELFKEAANLQGVTLTDFIVSSVHQAAVRALEARHVLELSRNDQKAFVKALLSPKTPNQRLRAAWARHASSDRPSAIRRAKSRRAR
jgi:uncharacterized protein (DUF1778 family)